MNDIIADQLKIQFKDYQDDFLWILIAFLLISLIIQFFSNLQLSKQIEKFKNILKQDEVKFNKHFDLQIDCLKNMYNNLVDLDFAYRAILKPTYFGHNNLKKSIRNLFEVYEINMDYFHRNKILLTDEIIMQIGKVNDNMNLLKKILSEEVHNLLEVEERNMTDDPMGIYCEEDREHEVIKKRIDDLNDNITTKSFRKDLSLLKHLVESYFKTLTK